MQPGSSSNLLLIRLDERLARLLLRHAFCCAERVYLLRVTLLGLLFQPDGWQVLARGLAFPPVAGLPAFLETGEAVLIEFRAHELRRMGGKGVGRKQRLNVARA